jgi:hypothetical protein
VAQIFGKPVYVITDVALLPLSSQIEADRAITAAVASRVSTTSATDSESELSDPGDLTDDESPKDVEPETPREDKSKSNPGATSFAKDVIANRGQYGRFAAQWFSKSGWRAGTSANKPPAPASQNQLKAQSAAEAPEGDAAAAANASGPKPDDQGAERTGDTERILGSNSVRDALPKILKTTRMVLTSGSFFFSYEFDLTRRLAFMHGTARAPSRETLDPLVCMPSSQERQTEHD